MVKGSWRRAATLAPLGCLLASIVAAQEATSPAVDAPLTTTTWTALGRPIRIFSPVRFRDLETHTGRITGIAAHPTEISTIYVATAGGGVWKTTNGTAWVPLTDSQPTLAIGAIAIAPNNPLVIYAGTGEANNSGDSHYGRGVLVSADGGTTWTLRNNGGLFDRRTIAAIAVDTTNADVAYIAVAARGVNGLSGNTGIWKTTNGGATWTQTTSSITSAASWSSVAVDPGRPSTVYGAVGEAVGSEANGVYKSTDGGATWQKLAGAPGGLAAGRIVIAVSSANPQVVYVSAQGTGSAGSSVFGSLHRFMRSDDGGVTFTDLTPGTPNYMGDQGWFSTTLVVDPTNAAIVYASGTTGPNSLIRSTDGGVSWSDIHGATLPHVGPAGRHHAAAFDAAGRYLDGGDHGISWLNNLETGFWTSLNGNLDTIQFRSVAVGPTNASYVLGGHDQTTSLHDTPTSWIMVDGGGGLVEFSPTNRLRAYHQTPGSSAAFFRRNDNSGLVNLEQDPDIDFRHPGWVNQVVGITDQTPDRQNLYAPFVVDPGDGDRVLYGARHVWETADGGDSWTALGNPFPGNVGAIGVSPSDPDTVYAYASGQMFYSRDRGATWTRRPSPPGNGTVNEIQVDPLAPLTVYAVVGSFNDNHGNVFRTTDGFLTWQNISGNLPDLPTWSLQIDPSAAGTLYIATDVGVYRTLDDGGFWNRFGLGLPNVQVFQIKLNTTLHVLAAATYGRGLWEILTSDEPTLTARRAVSYTFQLFPGETLTADWQGIASPSATDRIALYPRGAANTAFIDWIYVSCSQTPGSASAAGSCPFPLPETLAPGFYQLRLLANDGSTVLATSNTVEVTDQWVPTLVATPAQVVLNFMPTAFWNGIVFPSPTDWIGLYESGAPSNAYAVDWFYVSCSKTQGSAMASGICQFRLPANLAPGSYQLRLFANNTATLLASSNHFTVVSGLAGAALSASPATLAPGEPLLTAWAGIAQPSATDWIGLYRSPSNAPVMEFIDWLYVSCSQTPGNPRAVGSCPFVLPENLAPGSYFLRLLANDGFTVLATSNTVTVTSAGGPTLTASPATASPGGTLSATWSGIVSPSPTDWIGLYAPGSPDSAYAAWIYVSCSQTPGSVSGAGSCPFALPGTLPAGTYQLRLFANDSFTVLVTSNNVAVTTGGPMLTATPAIVPPGGTLTAAWSGVLSPSATDWIGLYQPGAAVGAYLDWIYVSCSKTPGSAKASGSCPLTLPANLAGSYELRLFAADGFTMLATSNEIRVTGDGGGTLTTRPTSVGLRVGRRE